MIDKSKKYTIHLTAELNCRNKLLTDEYNFTARLIITVFGDLKLLHDFQ